MRPEKIILVTGDEADPPGTHVEPGRIRDVIYAGVLTRYVVDLDGGGELVVSRQNTERTFGRPPRAEPGRPRAARLAAGAGIHDPFRGGHMNRQQVHRQGTGGASAR